MTKKYYCPVCDSTLDSFEPLSPSFAQKANEYGYPYFGQGEMIAVDTYLCGNCSASDRERLYAYWILWWSQKLPCKGKSIRALHFAPEKALSAFLKYRGVFGLYKTADLCMVDVDYHADLMQLEFSSESFDFFICSHVLEHVHNDRKAISELFRITAHGGYGIIVAPIMPHLVNTIEDPDEPDPAIRYRRFGQDDHLRLYSRNDFVSRIESAGFVVSKLGLAEFGTLVFSALGLTNSSTLYVVQKP